MLAFSDPNLMFIVCAVAMGNIRSHRIACHVLVSCTRFTRYGHYMHTIAFTKTHGVIEHWGQSIIIECRLSDAPAIALHFANTAYSSRKVKQTSRQ